MKEIKDIILAYSEAQKRGLQSALATVVHLEGSSYRRPGARMLVTEEGMMTGAISGGCLEGDALRKALYVMNQQEARLVTYDTNDEDDLNLGVQLGCNGIIQILIEPVHPENPLNPIELLKKIRAKRQQAVLVTFFDPENKNKNQPGTRLLLEEDGSLYGNLDDRLLKETVLEDARKAMLLKLSLFKKYNTANQQVTAFIEYFTPAVSLVIVGAGNDAHPMLGIADILGWETSIVDGRATHATAERFMAACQVLVSRPESALEHIPIDDQTVFVLMTHNYNYDLAILRALLQTKAVYIGVLGPKKKLDRMLDEIQAGGLKLNGEQLSRVYGPVGLDIGSETPGEIAISVIAEIKSVLAGKSGQSLRMKDDVIHPREDLLMEEKRLN
jgi:xanthine/CO dehydrogenase XdhC/CoxF family maturation factor